MKKRIFLVILSCFWFSLFCATEINYGSVSGTWSAVESPYLIQGEITIPASQSLVIEPGVEVIFQGSFRFIVNGQLIAEGTANDSILFTAENKYAGWKGIRFINTTYNGQTNSKLRYCRLQYGLQNDNGTSFCRGGGMLLMNSSNVWIQNSVFTSNKSSYGGAITLYNSSPMIHSICVKNNFATADGGGLYISTNSNPQITNLQIYNNQAIHDGGGMFICGNSAPAINNVEIFHNDAGYEDDCGGGGVFIWSAQPVFENCIFRENSSGGFIGGIIIVNESEVEFINSVVTHNTQGGIYSRNSIVKFSGTSITHNVSNHSAGGINSYGTDFIFDPVNRSSIYSNLNLSENHSNDIELYSADSAYVYLDTFTVAVPTETYASPLQNITFDIENALFEPTGSDLYVSLEGSNANSGTSADEPLKSLSLAVQMIQPDSLNPRTIFIEEGTYAISTTHEVFPIVLKSYLTIQGTSKYGTVLDAEETDIIFVLNSLTEVNCNDFHITNGYSNYYNQGGGIECNNSNLTLQNMTITKCYSQYAGGAIDLGGTSILNVEGTSIHNNNSESCAGAIYRDYGSPSIYFNSDNLCSIYLNNGRSSYEIDWYNAPIEVIVDTFTVLEPDESYLTPFSYFTYSISNAICEPVAADLYVSPDGLNTNSGLSADEPLKSISFAIQMMVSTEAEPHTIYLAEGVYSPSNTSETYPVHINKSYITLSGVNAATSILDAEQTNGVVFINQNHTTVQNLSVINGRGYSGAGIRIESDYTILADLIIRDNATTMMHGYSNGGGIYCYGTDTFIENSSIFNNVSSREGGGIYTQYQITLSGVTIKNNTSISDFGGGICCSEDPPIFDADNLCNIMNNQTLGEVSLGNDIYYYFYDPNSQADMQVIVDTFSIQIPGSYFAYPTDHIDFNMQNYLLSSIEDDLYVSPVGNNSNSGLSADNPFQSIAYALNRIAADSLNRRTINLAAGTYTTGSTGEYFPLNGTDFVTLQGESMQTTILDGVDEYRILYLDNIEDFSIKDCTLQNAGLHSYNYNYPGGAINSMQSNLSLQRVNLIHNFSNNRGGAIHAQQSIISISDSYLYDNEASLGGTISSKNSDLFLTNNTICFNDSYNGSAIYYKTDSWIGNSTQAILVNQLCWGNCDNQILLDGNSNDQAKMTISNSLIEGGEAGIHNCSDDYVLYWEEGNIDANPLFGESDNEMFMLQPASPCVDAGTDYFEWENMVYLDMLPEEYLGNAPDMGAWESEYVSSEIPKLAVVFGLKQNYPNPFNPETKIQFSIPVEADVKLAIYNVKGQKVNQLVNDRLVSGHHQTVWNGKDNSGKQVSSGIYFYTVKASIKNKTKFKKTRKMMLLK